MDEDYCFDCGKRRILKAFFKCAECLEAWMNAAAQRCRANDLS